MSFVFRGNRADIEGGFPGFIPYNKEMSQEQPRRPASQQDEPIRYGDVFPVQGDLATKPVAPQDASMMQTAEAKVLGQTQKGGPAATMQSAATRNERAGFVGHRDLTDAAGDGGVTVAETDVPGSLIITEAVAGQVVEEYVKPAPISQLEQLGAVGIGQQSAITIGEALEAAAHTAGDKPVDAGDAAAIQAAEAVITALPLGEVGATAQAAATYNAEVARGEAAKIMLSDVLGGTQAKLRADKVATREVAEGVISAELRNSPNLRSTEPGGMADSIAAAASLNERI